MTLFQLIVLVYKGGALTSLDHYLFGELAPPDLQQTYSVTVQIVCFHECQYASYIRSNGTFIWILLTWILPYRCDIYQQESIIEK